MNFLPGRDRIADELLLVCALAQSAFVTPQNFSALPYLEHLIRDRSRQALVEGLLSIAIKLRFLDDQTDLLKQKDRRQKLIGKYTEDGLEKTDDICVRLALNKLVHHDSIKVRVDDWSGIVVSRDDEEPTDMKLIPPGRHKGRRVIVSVEGKYKGTPWRFDIDLYKLMDEMLRVLE
jgi:hypothetical protein